MAVEAERLLAVFEARFTQLEKALDKARGNSSRTFTSMEKDGTRAEKALTDVGRTAQKTASVLDRINKTMRIETGGFGDRAADVAEYGKELDRLRAKYDPVFAASQRYDEELAELNRALAVGAVNADQHAAALGRLNSRYTALRGQAGAATNVLRANQFEAGNLAAQFNDIGVQLAGGQSPFLIALQQGTQINQVLGGGGGLRGTVSLLAGAFASMVNPVSLATIGLIAAGGYAIQYFASIGDNAEPTEATLEEQASLIQQVADRWGDAIPALREYANELKRMQEEAELQQGVQITLNASFDEVRALLPQVKSEIGQLSAQLLGVGERGEAIKQLSQAFYEVRSALDEAATAIATGEDATDELQRASASLADLQVNDAVPANGGLRDSLNELAAAYRRATVEASRLAAQEATGDDGSEVPALRFTWTPPGDVTIDTVRFQYGPGSIVPAKPFSDSCSDPEAGEYVTTKNVSSGLHYTARCTISTTPDRFKSDSPWTTTEQATGAFSIYGDIDLDHLADDVKGNLAWISNGLREAQAAIANVALLVDDQDFQNQGEVRSLRRELVVTRKNVTASYEELITTLAGEIDGDIIAVSRRVETLEVEVEGKADVTVIDALSARIDEAEDGVEANATAITGLEANVGDFTASGAIKFEAAASPGGGWSRIGLYASADGGGSFEEAALFLDARTSGTPGSRIVAVAEQLVLTDGTDEAKPFVIEGGKLYADELRVRWAQIEDVVIEWAEIQNVQVDWADIVNVQIAWADIDTAVIDNLEVGTSNLGFKAVTDQVTISGNKSDYSNWDNWQTVDSLTIETAVGVFINLIGSASLPASGSGSNQMRLLRSDGVVLWSAMASLQDLQVSWNLMIIDSNIPTGQYRYDLQIRSYQSEGGVSGQARILYWKR